VVPVAVLSHRFIGSVKIPQYPAKNVSGDLDFMASLFETMSLRQHIVVFLSLISLGGFLLLYGTQFLDLDSFLSISSTVNCTKLNETHPNPETDGDQYSTPATPSNISTGKPVDYTDPMDITRNVFYGIFLEKNSEFQDHGAWKSRPL
jgi:hypothetical protein